MFALILTALVGIRIGVGGGTRVPIKAQNPMFWGGRSEGIPLLGGSWVVISGDIRKAALTRTGSNLFPSTVLVTTNCSTQTTIDK